MRVIRISDNGKDVYLSVTKEDIQVMLVSISFWLANIPHGGFVSAKLLRVVRRIEKDPDYFTESSDIAYDMETVEFLMFLNNNCNTVKIIPEEHDDREKTS